MNFDQLKIIKKSNIHNNWIMILQCSHGPCDTPKRLCQSVTWVLKWVSFYLIIAFSETLHQHICNRQVRKKTLEANCILGISSCKSKNFKGAKLLILMIFLSVCLNYNRILITLAMWPKRGILFMCSKRRNWL